MNDQALRIRRADVVVESPRETAVRFFTEDRSSTGSRSYDAYVMSGGSPAHRITAQDVLAINTTMGARSPRSDWARLIKRGDLPQLEAISRDIDLFQASDKLWIDEQVSAKLEKLFKIVIGRGIGIARATKMLHIKRPMLIPVCDSYVLKLMGIPDVGAESGVAPVEHLRAIRKDLLPTLHSLQNRLREMGCDRTLVRILDSLLWSGYPDTWLKRR